VASLTALGIAEQKGGNRVPAMYVVFSLTEGAKPDMKVFSRREDARVHARVQIEAGADTADVYEVVGTTDVWGATAAVGMGDARLVEARGKRASKAQIKEWLDNSAL
jgi:hypothetical protein